MDINPIILSIPVYFLLIGVEVIIQFFSNRKIYRLNDAIANVSCGITQQVTGAFISVVMIAAYQYVFEYRSLMHIPVTWWSVLLLVLAVDFCYYWAHRMSHEVNLFWGGHVVHHQSEDYNFSVALRQGSFQGIWTFWFYIPLAFVGFDTVTFLLINALNTVYQFWIHTETIGKLPKPLEFVFNTPSHHRVHHGRDPKYIDKNHAGSLIIWDRMFGTFQEEEERPTYGITKPVNTWNPIRANLEHYIDMARQLKQTRGIFNKAGIIFKKPGWRPADQGGYQPASEVDKARYLKYNEQPAVRLGIYVLVQFIIVLLLASFFLFSFRDLTLLTKLAFSTLVIWSVAQLGSFLDNQPRFFNLEYMRIILIATLPVLLHNSLFVTGTAIIFTLASSLWFFQSSSKPAVSKSVSNA